jgi:hypothetical protein
LVARNLRKLSCVSSASLHRHVLSLLIIYVKLPCPPIINTHSICHHTMFFHSNAALVYQTSKRKRVIAEPEGVVAKSLKKVVVPQKSDSTPLILAIEPAPQNLGYRNYAARCFALVSTCCLVSLYLHSYLVDYVTSVCMITCISTVLS